METVKVCLRVRPLIGIELNKDCKKITHYPAEDEIVIGADKNFTFDYVFDETRKQNELYQGAIAPVVKSFMNGYNTTILAYGQTGSGKTYTMGTAGRQEGNYEDLGIIPRFVTDLFLSMEDNPEVKYEIRACFLEIHNEQIRDLLNPTSERTLAIREGVGGEITVSGAEEVVVTTSDEMFQALELGTVNRATGSTNMNHTSSRSHAVFTIILTQTKKQKGTSPPSSPSEKRDEDNLEPGEEDDEILTSKFHFVDLAGSERLKKTGATGDRMKEGISINCGLLALANCISALAEAKKGGHVPFRDSKITRLLQDSLGGNSQTLMIACVSPADVNFEESLNTLRYASRARNIKNKPVINRNPHVQKILRLNARIAELEALLSLHDVNVPSSGQFRHFGFLSRPNKQEIKI